MINIPKKEDVIIADLWSHLCGEKIGEGVYRTVYQHAAHEDRVVKIEHNEEMTGENFREWDVWNRVEYTQHAKWFADCYWISPSGRILTQKKTKPITKMPEKIPNFFTDLKEENFGKIGNRIVCHDYAINLLVEKGMTKRMRSTKYFTL